MIVATYVYFLLFAQFGFLALVDERGISLNDFTPIMAVMGMSGLASSLLAGVLLSLQPARRLQRIGLVGCAATAIVSVYCYHPISFMLVAFLVGLFTGLLTVSIAADLRNLIRGRGLGLKVGLGTGLAYFICNLPFLFAAEPVVRAIVPAAVCMGAWAISFLPRRDTVGHTPATGALRMSDFRLLGFVAVVVSFLALVWLDSAAFAVIQRMLSLKGLTWETPAQQWAMGSTHLLAALLAGWLIDRGRFHSLLQSTVLLLAVSLAMLQHHPAAAPFVGPLYAIAISIYSTALVLYPALGPDGPGLVPRRLRAALLYGVAGWIGSALGVGMAQNVDTIPTLFIVAAFVLVCGATMARNPGCLRTLACAYGPVVAIGLLAWPALPIEGWAKKRAETAEHPAVRGRRVYLQEGCINCHSQYIRPQQRDVAWWGPHRPIDRNERPLLIGNRRQGPDLANVGNRRELIWQQIHLAEPALVSPGSRMPSYRHLFEKDDSRGENLLAYLQTLGLESQADRIGQTMQWIIDPQIVGASARGKDLFEQSCVSCHGQIGAGDGPLAEQLNRPGLNLRKERFFYVPQSEGPDLQVLARVIKFGLPGTPMAGHEYFNDQDVADLAAYVQDLWLEAKHEQ